jgi:tryptophanase
VRSCGSRNPRRLSAVDSSGARPCEHLIDKISLKPGQVVLTNYHFTTTRAHVEILGGRMLEIYIDEALKTDSTHPFKGNIDPARLDECLRKYGREGIAYVRWSEYDDDR